MRWRLNHVLMVHLAKEDRHVYPRLQSCGEARVEAMATRFADEMGGLAQAYLAYASDWTAQKIAEDWPGYATATLGVMRALRTRIRREERDLYPMIDRVDSRLAAPADDGTIGGPQPIIRASIAP